MKLNSLALTIISLACISAQVYAKQNQSNTTGPTHPASQEWVLQQLANFSPTQLSSQDWSNLCSSGSITNGCYVNCTTSKAAACTRVLGIAHAAIIDGIPTPIVDSGMYVKALTPGGSSSVYGPFLQQTSGNTSFCTLHDVSGVYISNRGTYSENGTSGPDVVQYRNTSPSSSGKYYSQSDIDGTPNYIPLYQSDELGDGLPIGQTFYMICLGATRSGNAYSSAVVSSNLSVTW